MAGITINKPHARDSRYRSPGMALAPYPGSSKTRPIAFYVYILTNARRGVLYTGMTNDLVRRIFEHRQRATAGFSNKYGLTSLVYFEQHATAETAITREKAIKRWARRWKFELIEASNPNWDDLWDTITK